MKDVETDREFKIPTTAVRWGYSHDKELNLKDRNLIYFITIIIIIDVIYSLPFIFRLLSPLYFYILLAFGVPLHLYAIYKMFGRQTKESLRRHALLFILGTAILSFVLVIDKITVYGVVALSLFVAGWYVVMSLIGVKFSKG